MVFHIKTGMAHGVAAVATIIALMLLLFAVGPKVEAKFYPPLTDVSAVSMSADASSTQVFLKAEKNRSCIFIGSTAKIKTPEGNVFGRVTMRKAEGNEVTPEQQREATGAKFIRILKVEPAGTDLVLLPEYQCHPFWRVVQEIKVTK